MTVYETIKEMCKEHGISIHELERRAGIGNGTIGRWKNSTARLSSIEKAAGVFGVTAAQIIDASNKCVADVA